MLTSCAPFTDYHFTGELVSNGERLLLGHQGVLHTGGHSNPAFRKWNYVIEGSEFAFTVAAPRRAIYADLQLLSPSNSFGVFALSRNKNAKNGMESMILNGRIRFHSEDGTSFEIDAISSDGARGISGRTYSRKRKKFEPLSTLRAAGWLTGFAGMRTVEKIIVEQQAHGEQRLTRFESYEQQ